MKFTIKQSGLALGALLCAASLSLAAQGTTKAAPSQPQPAAAAAAPKAPAKSPKQKPLEINHASKETLLKLPGVSPATANQIIAGRPYNSKADLVSRKIISMLDYQLIRTRIYVIPPLRGKKK